MQIGAAWRNSVRSVLCWVLLVIAMAPSAMAETVAEGLNAYSDGDFESALANFEDTISLKPSDEHVQSEALTYAGVIVGNNVAVPDIRKGLTYLQESFAIEPDNAVPYHYRGRLEQERKRYDRASYWFRKALELEPDFFWARHALSIVESEAG
mgnify:CR=1 FL=1